MPKQLPNHDAELARFFTNVEYLRNAFRQLVAAPALSRRIFVIHGVGGVGKSSLLRMLRLQCKSEKVPVALASGDEAKSAVEVLSDWATDLKEEGVTLATFTKTFGHYRAIQSKVEDKAKESNKQLSELPGKAVGKVADAAVGGLVGAAVGSVIPGLGTIVGALGGMGAEALVDWLRAFLTKPDIDLLLDPTKKLTDDFLTDLVRHAANKRLVLMLDAFEQMTALDDWVGAVAQRLHSNVLLVVAGRVVPSWKHWHGWLAQAQVEELKPMTEEVMHDLVRSYYATMRGGEPDAAQVKAIIRFARGLPIVVTSAVKLWVQYGVEDFQTVKPQVVADLVDRLMEGVPSEMLPALAAAATVRWFNKEILRAVTLAEVDQVYSELRRFPFVRPRIEGLALHDTVREMIDENLRVHEPDQQRELHERAARYFETRLAKVTGEEAERLRLERLYHRVRADEETGCKLFQEMAEELVQYRLVERLRSLLNDVNSYSLERENSKLWREYYGARWAHLEARLADAEKTYQLISEDEKAEPRLRAYALNDWGTILARYERLGQEGGAERATRVLKLSSELAAMDSHLIETFSLLARVARYGGQWDKQKTYLEQVRNFYEERRDDYGLLQVFIEMKETSARQGDWRGVFVAHTHAKEVTSRLTKSLAPKGMLLGRWVWVWALAGRFHECEQDAAQSLAIARELQDDFLVILVLRDLGWAAGVQGKFAQANQ